MEAAPHTKSVELLLEGMTCASCANRIERKLNQLPGVAATVNYATEKAAVAVPGGFELADLLRQVDAAGYKAQLVEDGVAIQRTPTPKAVTTEEFDVAGPADVAEKSADARAAERTEHELGQLKRRVIISAILSLPVIALAMVPALQFDYWKWVSLALATPVILWGGWPFHVATWRSLRRGAATMDTLITLGTTAAFAWSLYALVFGAAGAPGLKHEFNFALERSDGMHNVYFEVAAGVITFVLLGRYLEKRAKRKAGGALRALLEAGPDQAQVLRDGTEVTIPVRELAVGDHFVVRPGGRIPSDGVVTAGHSALDQSIVTGEPVPVEVEAGSHVVGGTISTDGTITVKATAVGSQTQLARMARLVEEAQTGKAQVQRLVDRISAIFVPAVLVIALGTLAYWWLGGNGNFAVSAAVAVLVIACPCALGLATPTALLVGTGRGAQLGILIRGPEVLEASRKITTVIFDKTGTLTEGKLSVAAVHTNAEADEDALAYYAGSVEAASEHPLARAIADYARGRVGKLAAADTFRNDRGRGVRGEVDGKEVKVGRLYYVSIEADNVCNSESPRTTDNARNIDSPCNTDNARDVDKARNADDTPNAAGGRDVGSANHAGRVLSSRLQELEASGYTTVAVAVDGNILGLIALEDTIREAAPEVIAALKANGMQPVLATGDNEQVANVVASKLGIERVYARALPEDKSQLIETLRAAGETVAMVGDGVNDAPALASSDLGISLGAGTDIAIEASDITLVRSELTGVLDAILLARRTLTKIRSNLFWAFGYNVAVIPAAAAGLLNPMLAGAAMAFSSVFVVANSLLLARFKPTRTRLTGRASSTKVV